LAGGGSGVCKGSSGTPRCVRECYIQGEFYAAGALNPSNPCMVCNPDVNPLSWSYLGVGASCNDGSACTTNDTCQAPPSEPNTLVCKGERINCDDGNVCTTDTCDPVNGCLHTCDVGKVVRQGVCAKKFIVMRELSAVPRLEESCEPVECLSDEHCSSANNTACLANKCDTSTYTCQMTPINEGGRCNDNNACTTADKCSNGRCIGGSPLSCDDGNICTTDSCDPSKGCIYTNNTLPCDDGNACTRVDRCSNGACVGSDPVICTASDQCHDAGTCDPATGICDNPAKADGTPCDDGNECTEGDRCVSKKLSTVEQVNVVSGNGGTVYIGAYFGYPMDNFSAMDITVDDKGISHIVTASVNQSSPINCAGVAHIWAGSGGWEAECVSPVDTLYDISTAILFDRGYLYIAYGYQKQNADGTNGPAYVTVKRKAMPSDGSSWNTETWETFMDVEVYAPRFNESIPVTNIDIAVDKNGRQMVAYVLNVGNPAIGGYYNYNGDNTIDSSEQVINNIWIGLRDKPMDFELKYKANTNTFGWMAHTHSVISNTFGRVSHAPYIVYNEFNVLRKTLLFTKSNCDEGSMTPNCTKDDYGSEIKHVSFDYDPQNNYRPTFLYTNRKDPRLSPTEGWIGKAVLNANNTWSFSTLSKYPQSANGISFNIINNTWKAIYGGSDGNAYIVFAYPNSDDPIINDLAGKVGYDVVKSAIYDGNIYSVGTGKGESTQITLSDATRGTRVLNVMPLNFASDASGETSECVGSARSLPTDPCKIFRCDPKEGMVYENVADGTACGEAQDACHTVPACSNGVCGESTVIADCCLEDSDCADADPCTVDACVNNKCVNNAIPNCCPQVGATEPCSTREASANKCIERLERTCGADNRWGECKPVLVANGTPCGVAPDACHQAPVCLDGVCGIPLPIPDPNPNAAGQCEQRVCDPVVGWMSIAAAGRPCDDGNACTENDICDASATCSGTALPTIGTRCSEKGADGCEDIGVWACKADKSGLSCVITEDVSANECGLCGGVPLPDKGKPCSKGEGKCQGTGEYECAADKNSLFCNASAKPDGTICEAATDACHEPAVCTGGVCGQVTKKPDCCLTDAECDDNNVCNGIERCVGNKCVAGEALEVPADETCKTYRCDPVKGIVSNNVAGEDVTCGLGKCRHTIKSCIDGVVQVCNPMEGASEADVTCDGIDDDCDGQTDEDYVAEPTSCGIGACAASGHTSCVNGKVVDSCTPLKPETEICDGIDNDCDGAVDEDFALGAECVVGEGECKTKGKLVCAPDKRGVECDAKPLNPTAEICDGKDNNCDGIIDNALTDLDDGDVCTEDICDPISLKVVHRTIENCCKSASDCADAFACTRDACESNRCVHAGIEGCCEAGMVENCYTGPSGTKDIGVCKGGTHVCASDNKYPATCDGEVVPSSEICDGLDNDCNGKIDDNIAGLGSECDGECGKGITTCIDGKLVCKGAEKNTCGGCATLPEGKTPGSPCSVKCMKGVLVCSKDGNSFDCKLNEGTVDKTGQTCANENPCLISEYRCNDESDEWECAVVRDVSSKFGFNSADECIDQAVVGVSKTFNLAETRAVDTGLVSVEQSVALYPNDIYSIGYMEGGVLAISTIDVDHISNKALVQPISGIDNIIGLSKIDLGNSGRLLIGWDEKHIFTFDGIGNPSASVVTVRPLMMEFKTPGIVAASIGDIMAADINGDNQDEIIAALKVLGEDEQSINILAVGSVEAEDGFKLKMSAIEMADFNRAGDVKLDVIDMGDGSSAKILAFAEAEEGIEKGGYLFTCMKDDETSWHCDKSLVSSVPILTYHKLLKPVVTLSRGDKTSPMFMGKSVHMWMAPGTLLSPEVVKEDVSTNGLQPIIAEFANTLEGLPISRGKMNADLLEPYIAPSEDGTGIQYTKLGNIVYAADKHSSMMLRITPDGHIESISRAEEDLRPYSAIDKVMSGGGCLFVNPHNQMVAMRTGSAGGYDEVVFYDKVCPASASGRGNVHAFIYRNINEKPFCSLVRVDEDQFIFEFICSDPAGDKLTESVRLEDASGNDISNMLDVDGNKVIINIDFDKLPAFDPAAPFGDAVTPKSETASKEIVKKVILTVEAVDPEGERGKASATIDAKGVVKLEEGDKKIDVSEKVEQHGGDVPIHLPAPADERYGIFGSGCSLIRRK